VSRTNLKRLSPFMIGLGKNPEIKLEKKLNVVKFQVQRISYQFP
jgi:hypothetical protein